MKFFKKILGKILHEPYFIALLLVSTVVAITNFDPSAWLTGWDTLHPEFDFKLNFERMIFGAWREDQGLGAVAAHSHMSDLPRIIVLWIMSIFLPLHSVKQIYVILCLILGPLGIYWLSKFIINKTLARDKQFKYSNLASFISGLWYLLNLGTVQHFYVVFEMFAVQYAALPWLFLLSLKQIIKPQKKNLLLLGVISFFSAPMAYASTLWFAGIGGLLLSLMTYGLLKRNKIFLRQSILVGVIFLVTNAFWIFPNFYFLLSDASNAPKNAQINQLFSPEAFLHNQAYGTPENLALLKNFLFNWTKYSHQTDSFEQLLSPWIYHLEQPSVIVVGYFIAFLVILGAAISIVRYKKFSITAAILPAWFLSIFMLINENPPFTKIFSWLRSQSDFFEEGLRFPFTKFSILYMVLGAVFIAISWLEISKFADRLVPSIAIIKTRTSKYITILLAAAIIYFGSPAFFGQMIGPLMKSKIPTPYFELFNFMKTQPQQARVAQLPLQTIHGWDYYSWGYEGPGFIWFGIKQPFIARDFDRWEVQNETLFNQLSRALYDENQLAFTQTLEKYQIGYVLIDKSIVAPKKSNTVLFHQESEELLMKINAEVVFESDFLKLYKLPTLSSNSFVMSTSTIGNLKLDSNYISSDPVYSYGHYFWKPDSPGSVSFPFAKVEQSSIKDISIEGDYLNITAEIDSSSNSSISIPAIPESSHFQPTASIDYDQSKLHISFKPMKIFLDSREINIITPQAIEFEIPSAPENALIGINEQVIELQSGKQVEQILTDLIVNDDIVVSIFDAKIVGDTNELSLSDAAYTHTLSRDYWKWNRHHGYKLEPNTSTISLLIPINSHDLKQDLANQQPINCDPLYRGKISAVTQNNILRLSANQGSSLCLGAPITKNQYQILSVQDKTVSGRNLKIYVEDTETKRVILEKLVVSDAANFYNFATDNDDNLWLSIEARSFGSEINSIEIERLLSLSLPVSTSWISKIQHHNGPLEQLSEANINKIQKYSNFMYIVELNGSRDREIITLLQSYNPGWIGLDIKRKRVLDKAVFNSWANAWVIGEHEGADEQNKILILYAPQLLEFAGLALILCCFLYLIYRKDKVIDSSKKAI